MKYKVGDMVLFVSLANTNPVFMDEAALAAYSQRIPMKVSVVDPERRYPYTCVYMYDGRPQRYAFRDAELSIAESKDESYLNSLLKKG